ncbi:MAG: hypothetical protein HY962_08225 [Ignavibacteriae bacterium]|nr:hypothetical protein [Ignavibacteriota bacterium]
MVLDYQSLLDQVKRMPEECPHSDIDLLDKLKQHVTDYSKLLSRYKLQESVLVNPKIDVTTAIANLNRVADESNQVGKSIIDLLKHLMDFPGRDSTQKKGRKDDIVDQDQIIQLRYKEIMSELKKLIDESKSDPRPVQEVISGAARRGVITIRPAKPKTGYTPPRKRH